MRAHRIFGALFLAFLFFFAALNGNVAIDGVKRLIAREESFPQITAEIRDNYSNEITFRTDFINLNGLAARIAQRRMVNNVVRLDNGALKVMLGYAPVTEYAEKTVAFSHYLNEYGIKFAFVQVPDKLDPENKLLLDGLSDGSSRIANEFGDHLTQNGVPVIDLRMIFDYENGYFEAFNKTDHHWSTKGAFTAFAHIARSLAETFPNEKIDAAHLEIESYDVTTYEDWFLGSFGKRTGVYFAGVDDFDLITPAFPTDITTIIDKHRIARRGDFIDANIQTDILENGDDYFNVSTYVSYIGGDYPIVCHYNHLADNNLKVAILKDSFTLPVQAFLSAVCKQVMVVDLRYYTDGAAAKLLADSDPDIVLMMNYPSVMRDPVAYAWGDTTRAEVNENLLLQSDITVSQAQTQDLTACERADLDGAQVTLSFAYTGTPLLTSEAVATLRGTTENGAAYAQIIHVSEMEAMLFDDGQTRCSATLTLPPALASLDAVSFSANGGTISQPKLEYGARATAWCAAAEERAEYGVNLISNEYDPARIVVEPGDDDFAALRTSFTPGATYRFSAESIEFLEGESHGISIMLYDWENQKYVRQWTFDTAFAKDGIEWTFTVPNDTINLGLLIYPGMVGKTDGCSIEINHAQLIELPGI